MRNKKKLIITHESKPFVYMYYKVHGRNMDETTKKGGDNIMSNKFQKGDRVEYIGRVHVEEVIGIVVNIPKNRFSAYTIEADNGEIYHFQEDYLKMTYDVDRSANRGVARQRNIMNTLTILAKKVIDADLRSMIKIGWLDNSLQLTQDGEDAVLAHYLSENKAAFGKMAEEALKERKKDKDC